jgi:hypothetical protein
MTPEQQDAAIQSLNERLSDGKHLQQVRERIKADEIAKRPKKDPVCRSCKGEIPHGTEFVAISRYVTRGHVANPQFIGKQPVSYGVEAEIAGALCLNCVTPKTTTEK